MATPEDIGEHRHDEVLAPDVRFDSEGTFYYRAGQVLVGGGAEAVTEVNRRLGRAPRAGEDDVTAGVARVPVGDDDDILALVAELRTPPRGARGDQVELPVFPNQLLRGLGHAMPKPGSPPRPPTAAEAEAEAAFLSAPVDANDVRIAVLDSGVDAGGTAGPLLSPFATGDLDSVTATDGRLDPYCGHGTFIAGILRRYAPGAAIEATRVFDGSGFTDDFTVATKLVALAQAGVDVVSLSFGGYTFDNQAPPAMGAAIAALRDTDVAIVAAAGNENTSRPCWPAAFKGVVAVAALDPAGKKACFSNYGSWVDACAEGVDIVSTFLDTLLPAAAHTARPGCPEMLPVPDGFSGFARWSGTSFAAPRVAAVIANEVARGVSAVQAVCNLLQGKPHVDPGLGVHVS